MTDVVNMRRESIDLEALLLSRAYLYMLFHKLFVPSGGVSPLYFLRNYGVLLVVSILCCTPFIEKIWNLLKKNAVTRCAAILALLVVSTAYVVGSTNSPFLYFNF